MEKIVIFLTLGKNLFKNLTKIIEIYTYHYIIDEFKNYVMKLLKNME